MLYLVTVNNCIPVSLFLDNDSKNYELHFFNVTAEVTDNDFILRDECLSL